MLKIEVKKLSKKELADLNVFNWPVWEKEVSEFDWSYDDRERCYILEGEVEISSENEKISFKKEDFVVFPKGLKCKWKINKAVRKHYNFG